eukprot:3735688-Pyramimonas_sp.AAC.1
MELHAVRAIVTGPVPYFECSLVTSVVYVSASSFYIPPQRRGAAICINQSMFEPGIQHVAV